MSEIVCKGEKPIDPVFLARYVRRCFSLIICTRLRNSTTWCYLSLSFLRLLRSINWNISLMRLVSSVLVLEQEASCTGVKYALNPRLLAQCLARLWMNEWFKKIYYGKIDKETRTWSIPDSVTLSGFRIREQKIRLTFRKQLCFNSLIFFDFLFVLNLFILSIHHF